MQDALLGIVLEQQHGIYLGFFFFTKAQHGQKAAELFFFVLQGKLAHGAAHACLRVIRHAFGLLDGLGNALFQLLKRLCVHRHGKHR